MIFLFPRWDTLVPRRVHQILFQICDVVATLHDEVNKKKTGLAAQGGLDGGVGFVDDFGDEFRILQGLRRSKSTLFDMVTMLAEKCMVSKKKMVNIAVYTTILCGPPV